MLVLSRRVGEAIRIGNDVEVVVLAADGNQVRIGIRAPRDVTVLRKELIQQVQDENRAAAVSDHNAVLGRLRRHADSSAPVTAPTTPTRRAG
ncbi:MAG: carbon storage regulator CsrA [Chloroflexi bacterium]|nr:carbon storage regulator CsrA [Chloroflexota bacterium]